MHLNKEWPSVFRVLLFESDIVYDSPLVEKVDIVSVEQQHAILDFKFPIFPVLNSSPVLL